MNWKLLLLVPVAIILFSVGYFLGSYKTESEYQQKLLEQSVQYRESVKEARKQEQKWREYSYQVENDYQKKLSDIERSNAQLVSQLRKQLREYSSRMPKNTGTTSSSHDETRESRVSEELDRLIEFSERCSKRTDELIIQLSSLQDWIKGYNK